MISKHCMIYVIGHIDILQHNNVLYFKNKQTHFKRVYELINILRVVQFRRGMYTQSVHEKKYVQTFLNYHPESFLWNISYHRKLYICYV